MGIRQVLICAFTLFALLPWSAAPCDAQSKGGAPGPIPLFSPKAAPEDSAGKIKDTSPPTTPVFPGLAEVVPNESQLAKAAAEARERIAAAWDMSALNVQITDCEVRHEKMKELVGKMGDPDSWDLSRLTDARALILKDRKQIEAFVALISTKLTDLESIREEWENKQTFWWEWRRTLVAAKVELPTETFDKAQECTDAILQNVSSTAKQLIALQQKASKLLEENLKVSGPIEAAQKKLLGETFKRIEPSFISGDFFAQFNSSLWPTTRDNLADALNAENDFFVKHAWAPLVRAILILVIGLLVLAQRKSTATAGESEYLLDHPWALGIFVTEIIFATASYESSGLGRHLAFLLFSFSAWTLLPSISKDSRERFILIFLTALITGCGLAKLIALPSPLYRLASASFSLAGAIFFGTLAGRSQRLSSGWPGILPAGCVIGALFMVAALVSQVSGLVNLSDRLALSSAGTFCLLIAWVLALRIVNLTIDATLAHPIIARYRLINQFGAELGMLLKRIFRFAIHCLSFLQLFRIWGVYASTGQAAEKLLGYRINLGSLTLSLGLIVAVMLIFFCSRSISWFARAVLETEVFPRKNVERGAGVAINKLVHYSLVFTAFLIGLNVIGIDLKTFAVLGGALGLGIGFGLQNIVNNFISGLILLFERPVSVSDMVIVDNEQGRVRKIGLRSTIIETLERSHLIVPNSRLISQNVINLTLSNSIARLKIQVGVAYGSDIELVLAVLREAAVANPRVMCDPAPSALLLRFGKPSLDFELHVFLADVSERLVAQSEISQEIAKRFQGMGIEIAIPQMDLHLRSIQEEATGVIRGIMEGMVPTAKR